MDADSGGGSTEANPGQSPTRDACESRHTGIPRPGRITGRLLGFVLGVDNRRPFALIRFDSKFLPWLFSLRFVLFLL